MRSATSITMTFSAGSRGEGGREEDAAADEGAAAAAAAADGDDDDDDNVAGDFVATAAGARRKIGARGFDGN